MGRIMKEFKVIGIQGDNTVSLQSIHTYVGNRDILPHPYKENLTYEDVLLLVGNSLNKNPSLDKSRALLLKAALENSA